MKLVARMAACPLEKPDASAGCGGGKGVVVGKGAV